MNWKWKPQTLLLPGLALALALAGCQSQQAATASPSAAPAAETPAVEVTPAAGNESGTRTVTDMAGREVEVPAVIDSVYSTAPTGTMLMYTFDDELVTGLNVELLPHRCQRQADQRSAKADPEAVWQAAPAQP